VHSLALKVALWVQGAEIMKREVDFNDEAEELEGEEEQGGGDGDAQEYANGYIVHDAYEMNRGPPNSPSDVYANSHHGGFFRRETCCGGCEGKKAVKVVVVVGGSEEGNEMNGRSWNGGEMSRYGRVN
jgi:hypothetical protein